MMIKKLRHYHLKKQNLLQKAETGEYPEILKNHIGLHSTDYITPYISLWARVQDFDPGNLFDDINNRNAVRMRAFRGTVFVIHRDNLKMILGGSRHFLKRVMTDNINFGRKQGADLEKLEQQIISLITENGPLTAGEIKKKFDNKPDDMHFMIAMRILDMGGTLVRSSQRYITDKVIIYELMTRWIHDADFDNLNSDTALEDLIFQYINKFGPVCLEDICWWLPLTKTFAKKFLERLENKLIRLSINDTEYIMEKEDYNRFENFTYSDRNTVINFLPYEDHFPKAYNIRDWFLSEEISPRVLSVGMYKTDYGQLRPTIWLNGEIIGRWEIQWKDKDKSEAEVEIVDINKKNVTSGKVDGLIETRKKELKDFINEKLVAVMKKRT
ncbi:winged helix DNA-binding domain-containing protein [candidate division KSB1 bacterium]